MGVIKEISKKKTFFFLLLNLLINDQSWILGGIYCHLSKIFALGKVSEIFPQHFMKYRILALKSKLSPSTYITYLQSKLKGNQTFP